MKAKEFLERYSEEALEKKRVIDRRWKRENPEKCRESRRKWALKNPEKVRANHREQDTKGGKYYEKQLKYKTTGLSGDRHRIRMRHAGKYRNYKKIIAPESQIHHEWIPGTSKYNGVALVEKNQHQHGFIEVIELMGGKITLFREERFFK